VIFMKIVPEAFALFVRTYIIFFTTFLYFLTDLVEIWQKMFPFNASKQLLVYMGGRTDGQIEK